MSNKENDNSQFMALLIKEVATEWRSMLENGEIYNTTPKLRDLLTILSGKCLNE